MFWLKACPKCAGALYLERDIYGRYLNCVNCGHHLHFAEESASRGGGYREGQMPPGLRRGLSTRSEPVTKTTSGLGNLALVGGSSGLAD